MTQRQTQKCRFSTSPSNLSLKLIAKNSFQFVLPFFNLIQFILIEGNRPTLYYQHYKHKVAYHMLFCTLLFHLLHARVLSRTEQSRLDTCTVFNFMDIPVR